MIQCSKCGRELGINDRFCPDCGEKLILPENGGSSRPKSASDSRKPAGQTGNSRQAAGQTATQNSRQPAGQTANQNSRQAAGQTATQNSRQPAGQTGENAVRYVYVDKKTGKIMGSPHSTKGADGCLSFLGIAIAAVVIVMVMVVGSMLIAGNVLGRSGSSDDDDWLYVFQSESEPVSEDTASETRRTEPVSSDEASSQVTSSEPVSSVQKIPDELLAKNLQKKIKGKWRTDVPYKNMNLPGTFEFDGKGKCKFTVSAFLFSKKFDGRYTIRARN